MHWWDEQWFNKDLCMPHSPWRSWGKRFWFIEIKRLAWQSVFLHVYSRATVSCSTEQLGERKSIHRVSIQSSTVTHLNLFHKLASDYVNKSRHPALTKLKELHEKNATINACDCNDFNSECLECNDEPRKRSPLHIRHCNLTKMPLYPDTCYLEDHVWLSETCIHVGMYGDIALLCMVKCVNVHIWKMSNVRQQCNNSSCMLTCEFILWHISFGFHCISNIRIHSPHGNPEDNTVPPYIKTISEWNIGLTSSALLPGRSLESDSGRPKCFHIRWGILRADPC